jgi:hypothetical protein
MYLIVFEREGDEWTVEYICHVIFDEILSSELYAFII